MNIALWISHALIVFAFGMAGFSKAVTPIETLGLQLAWVNLVPVWVVTFAVVAELAAVVALVVVPLVRRYTVLVPMAAAGLALIMVVGIPLHISSGMGLAPNIVLGSLAAFVAWGRWKALPLVVKS